MLLFFSASPGKREVYIFPMLPALCVAAGALLPGLVKRVGVQRTLLAYLLALSLGTGAMALLGLTGASEWAHRLAAQRDVNEARLQTFLQWMLALGVVSLAVILWGRGTRAGAATVVVTALLWATYGLGLAPTLDADSSARKLMQRVSLRIGPDAQLGMVAWREQNLLQSDRATLDFGFKNAWETQWAAAGPWLQADPSRRWIFVLEKALSPCVDRARVVDIGQSNRNRWLLVPGTAWKRGCITPAFTAEESGIP